MTLWKCLLCTIKRIKYECFNHFDHLKIKLWIIFNIFLFFCLLFYFTLECLVNHNADLFLRGMATLWH